MQKNTSTSLLRSSYLHSLSVVDSRCLASVTRHRVVRWASAQRYRKGSEVRMEIDLGVRNGRKYGYSAVLGALSEPCHTASLDMHGERTSRNHLSATMILSPQSCSRGSRTPCRGGENAWFYREIDCEKVLETSTDFVDVVRQSLDRPLHPVDVQMRIRAQGEFSFNFQTPR